MPKTQSPIMQELADSPCVMVGGVSMPITRKPMRAVFKLLHLLQHGFGDLLDTLQGALPAEVMAKLAAAETEEESQQIIRDHMASPENGINAQMKRLLAKEEVFYEVLALALDADAEWVADHVTLDAATQAVAIVMEQEMSADFFAGALKLRSVWQETKRLMNPTTDGISPTTTTDGFGNSLPNSQENGPLYPQPVY
jgi:hypothetical protein